MASGDTVYEFDSMFVTGISEDTDTTSVELRVPYQTSPTDKYANITLVHDNQSNNVEQSPFDPTKQYDIVIKEH